jgi:hypothetical protein
VETEGSGLQSYPEKISVTQLKKYKYKGLHGHVAQVIECLLSKSKDLQKFFSISKTNVQFYITSTSNIFFSWYTNLEELLK